MKTSKSSNKSNSKPSISTSSTKTVNKMASKKAAPKTVKAKTMKTKATKPAKMVVKTASKGRGRPKGSKNKSPSKSNKPEQVAASGAVSVLDQMVVVSDSSEMPSSLIEKSSTASRSKSN